MSEALARDQHSGLAYGSLRWWRLMGQAELDQSKAVDEPKLPCCDMVMVDPKVEADADREAEDFFNQNKSYVYNWPAIACKTDMAIAGVASIGMQALEAILVWTLERGAAQLGCYVIIMVAALVTVAADVRCVRRTAISFVQEVQHFAVPLPVPESLKRSFLLYFLWGVGNTALHVWWLGSLTLTMVIAIKKHHHITHEVVIWCMINFRYVWGFPSFWAKEVRDGFVQSDFIRPRGEEKFNYYNCLRQEMGKVEFVHGLAATLGMQTMMLQITPYRRVRIEHNREVVKNAVDGNQKLAREEWGYCLGDFRRLTTHHWMQLAVTHIPKACTVLYQCLLLAVSLAKEETVLPQYTQILSILCAFVSFAPILITIVQVEMLYRTLAPLCEQKDFERPDGELERRGYVDKQRKDMRLPVWLFRVAYTLACVFQLLAVAQIVILLCGSRALLPGAAAFVSTY